MKRVGANTNARNMLETQAKHIGTIGGEDYYILDGKVWRVSEGLVYRSDDSTESILLQRLCREFQKGD